MACFIRRARKPEPGVQARLSDMTKRQWYGQLPDDIEHLRRMAVTETIKCEEMRKTHGRYDVQTASQNKLCDRVLAKKQHVQFMQRLEADPTCYGPNWYAQVTENGRYTCEHSRDPVPGLFKLTERWTYTYEDREGSVVRNDYFRRYAQRSDHAYTCDECYDESAVRTVRARYRNDIVMSDTDGRQRSRNVKRTRSQAMFNLEDDEAFLDRYRTCWNEPVAPAFTYDGYTNAGYVTSTTDTDEDHPYAAAKVCTRRSVD
jgi:hypothetical protein